MVWDVGIVTSNPLILIAMSTRVLIHDYPHRTLALVTDQHALIFRHSHAQPEANSRLGSQTSLSSTNQGRSNITPRCLVEFTDKASIDFTQFHTVGSAKGTLGLITLNNDVFLCVITGAEEVATVRPGETVQRIFAVEFCGWKAGLSKGTFSADFFWTDCLNRADYDHAHGPYPNPYPGQTFHSDDVDYGGGYDQADSN
jgi:hypothetical protein